jgi:predicted transposase/invertase (TIGR01784 family)
MDKLYKSHDGFFRKLMSEQQTAQDYLSTFLPDSLTTVVDFDTLEQDTESYIDDKLNASMSDVVFKANTKQGFGIHFCFLFEHKSYVDDKAPFQILHYIASAMLKRATNRESQRLIIPILFYHGEAPWDYESISDKFSALDDELKIYLPRFDYLFHNYRSTTDDEIRRAPNRKLTAALIAMKHFYEQGYLLERMSFLLLQATDEKGNLYKPLLVYLLDKLPDQMDAIQKQ